MSDQINHTECRELVVRMSKDFYGNGKPGALNEIREIRTAILGDMSTGGIGMATDLKLLKDGFKKFEDKPRDRMLKIKDVFYITLAVISIIGFVGPAVIKFIGGLL